MILKFDKLHGLGNDFVFINRKLLPLNFHFTKEQYSFFSNRKFGIGCDLIVIYEYKDRNIWASFINRDGSSAEICGNACRCLGLLLKKITNLNNFILYTDISSYEIIINHDNISVNMGIPTLSYKNIGINNPLVNLNNILSFLCLTNKEKEEIIDGYVIGLGNPHLILFLKQNLDINFMENLGRKLENCSIFSNRINVSFAKIINSKEIDLTVFERGVGITMACGSGACATAFAAFKLGKVASELTIHQKGGSLNIIINNDSSITQQGQAKYVFYGEIELCQ